MVDHYMLTVANSELKVNSILYYLTWLTTFLNICGCKLELEKVNPMIMLFGMVDHFFIRQRTSNKGIIRRFLECMDSSRM